MRIFLRLVGKPLGPHVVAGFAHDFAEEVGLTWPLPEGTDDAELERIVRARPGNFTHNRPLPDSGYLVKEMRKSHALVGQVGLVGHF